MRPRARIYRAARPGYHRPSGGDENRVTPFVHLHCHSDFSLLDGASSIERWWQRPRASGMERLALTDHGNMFGALAFYKECRAQGIVPIIGSEFYKAPGSRTEKSGSEKGTRHHHLVLLARNLTGYAEPPRAQLPGLHGRLLLQAAHRRRASGAAPRGAHRPERLSCRRHPRRDPQRPAGGGAVARAVLPRAVRPGRLLPRAAGPRDPRAGGREPGAREALPGDGHPAGGHERHPLHRARGRARAGRAHLHRHRQEGVRGQADEVRAPRVLLQVRGRDGARLLRASRGRRQHGAHRGGVRLELPALRPQFPVYEVPAGLHPGGLPHRARPQGAGGALLIPCLRRRRSGWSTSFPSSPPWASPATSSSSGTSSTTPRRTGSRSGPGRGSGAGSLVAYSLKITDIDPLKYGLLFERFLNPERVSMPDFDIDFCHRRRDEVISYVTRKYGEDKVGPDHHLRHAEGARGDPRRGARPRPALRRGGRHRQARARGPEDRPGHGAEGEPEAGGGGQPRARSTRS